jgi:hypothetical protein
VVFSVTAAFVTVFVLEQFFEKLLRRAVVLEETALGVHYISLSS